MLGPRDITILRAKGACERCGRTGTNIHHRKPRGMGGTRKPDVASNLLMLCGSGTTGCHGWIEMNRAHARAHGLLIRQTDEPHLTPIYLRGQWWLHHDNGNRSTPPTDGTSSAAP